MSAIPLFDGDGVQAGVWKCSVCSVSYAGEQVAQHCCEPRRCACGKTCRKHYTLCDDCIIRADERRELAKFEAAEKLTEWGGPVCCDAIGYNDGYFAGLDELYDHVASVNGEEEEEAYAAIRYAWTCDSRPTLQLDVDDMIEVATLDAPENWDEDRILGLTELRAAVEAFNALNTAAVTWTPNHKRAVLITWPPATKHEEPSTKNQARRTQNKEPTTHEPPP